MTAEAIKSIIDQMPYNEVRKLYNMLEVKPTSVNVVEEAVNLSRSILNHDKYLTLQECAEYLGLHKNTIVNRIKKGEINAIFSGGAYSIPKMQFIEQILKEVDQMH